MKQLQLNGDTRDHSILPQKYNKLIKKTTQIPRLSVIRLVERMDSDNDGFVATNDIVQFSRKVFLYYDEDVKEGSIYFFSQLAQRMFEEAANKRIITFETQLKKPLSVDEILGAVQVHYALNSNHEWVPNPRPYRQHWIKLLVAIGENEPVGHNLSPHKIEKILDMHELPQPLYKPQINKSRSAVKIYNLLYDLYQISIRPLNGKPFHSQYRPEAGIIINNTENIQEIVLEQQHYDPFKINAFERVVNAKIKENENDLPTIKFDTKMYYKEAERLSLNPKLFTKEHNPINSYVPENFNFQIKNEALTKKQTFNRLSKANTYLNSGELMESQFFKDIEEMQEYEDLDSLTLIQMHQENFQKNNNNNATTKKLSFQSSNHKNSLPLMTQNKNSTKRFSQTTSKFPQPPLMQVNNAEKEVKKILYSKKTQKIFVTTFKLEDAPTLKKKLAQKEPVTDTYVSPSQHQFREEYIQPKDKILFKTRIKAEGLPNPHGMSDHDQRPQFAIEKEMRRQQIKEFLTKREIDAYLGNLVQDKDWV